MDAILTGALLALLLLLALAVFALAMPLIIGPDRCARAILWCVDAAGRATCAVLGVHPVRAVYRGDIGWADVCHRCGRAWWHGREYPLQEFLKRRKP